MKDGESSRGITEPCRSFAIHSATLSIYHPFRALFITHEATLARALARCINFYYYLRQFLQTIKDIVECKNRVAVAETAVTKGELSLCKCTVTKRSLRETTRFPFFVNDSYKQSLSNWEQS